MGGRILLINMPINSYMKDVIEEEVKYNPSLGLLSIGTYLEFHGHEAKVIDYCYEIFSINNLLNIISEYKPDIVAFSCYTENFSEVIKVARKIKSRNNNIKTACGGAHPTLLFKECAKKIDYVIRREGESIFLELLEALISNEENIKIKDIEGLVYADESGEIVINKVRNYMDELDLLPIIKRELGDFYRYKDLVNIYSSKGCNGKCIYCSATAISGAKNRRRSAKNIFMEMVVLKRLFKDRLNKIFMVDDTFTASRERVMEFIDLKKKYDLNVQWECESRVDSMDRELASAMAEANCIGIQFGIESGSQEVLDKIRKQIDLNYAREVIKFVREFGMEPQLSFMLGHYCDTIESMEATYLFIKEAKKFSPKVGIGFNTPFPGTWQHSNREKLGIRVISENYSKYILMEPIIETNQFTVEDQRNIKQKIDYILND